MTESMQASTFARPRRIRRRGACTEPPLVAGFVSRLAAFVIDLFVMSFICLVAIESLHLTSEFFRVETWAIARRAVALASTAVILIVLVCYLPLSWAATHRSLGKAVMGLRIVTVDGAELTLARSLLRLAGYWLSALPLGLGFLWPIVDTKHRAFHDMLARTRVVYQPRERAAEEWRQEREPSQDDVTR